MSVTHAIAKAAPTHRDTKARIERLLAGAEARIRRAFLEAVRFARDQRSLEEIERLLVSGRVDEALAVADLAAARIATAWVREFQRAADDTAAFVGDRLGTLVDFDTTNVRAMSQVRQHRARLVREFTDEQRRATTRAVTEGFRQVRTTLDEGVATVRQVAVGPRETARAFRDSIGLTERQERAVANYRRLLVEGDREALDRALRDRRFDPTVRRAIESGEPLSRAQLDRMVERYRERYLKYRSEVIARTEALSAVNAGTKEMYRQAIEDGTLDPEALVQIWDTRIDGRERDSHAAMDGQERRIDEAFRTGDGVLLEYPGDVNAPADERIQCRCSVLTRFREA